jgi:hypothetical protein
LSSTVHDWNIAGNFIVEKNVSVGEGFEFGYAFGFARPLATLASGGRCRAARAPVAWPSTVRIIGCFRCATAM